MTPKYVAQLGLCVIGLSLVMQGCSSSGGTSELGAELGGPRGDVVMAALSELGTRYVYGAEAPGAALDCSALTQHAYQAAGIEIPRVSTAQQLASTPISPTKVKPGDLVFFKIRRGQYHVGLMVDRQRFVHASTSERAVRVSYLDDPYWQHHLTGAGTYLN
jgi:cell wall-associated NlpC family hydrolase